MLRTLEKKYLEVGLPKYLQHDIDQLLEHIAVHSSVVDCAYNELQSSINCAEIDEDITEEQAAYLRNKCL